MAYFSNSTEGMIYMEQFCMKCVNWRDKDDGRGPGCAIIDLHSLWNYDAIGKDADKTKAEALSHFIPVEANGIDNGECVMFQKTPVPSQRELERAGQLRMGL